MLPDFLTSQYQQYKKDTDAIASWLAKTAKSCGYAPDLLCQDEVAAGAQKPPKLKGRARKLAREAAPGQKQPRAPPPQGPVVPVYTILVRDFTSLAEYIAGYTKSPVQVPRSVSAALDRAIAARKEHGSFLSAAGSQHTPREQDSHGRHSHFIGVLERVRDTLRSLMPARVAADDSVAQTGSDGPGKTANLFAGLTVQEPSESFLRSPDIKIPRRAEPQYQAEQPQDLKEAFVAFHLIIKDLCKLRGVIVDTWAGYRVSRFDIVAASITTNTAIDFARSLEEGAEKIFAAHGGIHELLMKYHVGECWDCKEDDTFRERPGDVMNFHMYDYAEPSMYPTFIILESYKQAIAMGRLPRKPGNLGEYDPDSDRSRKSSRERFAEDTLVFHEAFTEFAALGLQGIKLPAEDELTRGLRLAVFEQKDLNLWIIFAVQVFLDIHHVLREDVDLGLQHLRWTADIIKSSLQSTLKLHEKERDPNWPRSNDRLLVQIVETIERWVEGDPIQEMKLRRGCTAGKPQQLFANHPLYCGLLTYRLKTLFHVAGVQFANAWASVLSAQHLYNALRQEGFLSSSWKDLELLQIIQGPLGLFTGSSSTDPEIYVRRHLLAMGFSASSFASDNRRNELRFSNNGPRLLAEQASVANMFMERYCYNSGGVDLKAQDVEKILEKGDWGEEDEESKAEDGLGDCYSLVKNTKPRKKSCNRRRLTMVELVGNLRTALQGEILEMSYDYFMIHRVCWYLLRSVKESCDGPLKEFLPDYVADDSEPPCVVTYILGAAVKYEDPTAIAVLVRAAKMIDDIFRAVPGAGETVVTVLREYYNIVYEGESDVQE